MSMGVKVFHNKRSWISTGREGVRRYAKEAHTANFTLLQLALRTLASLSTVHPDYELRLPTRKGFLVFMKLWQIPTYLRKERRAQTKSKCHETAIH